MLLFLTVDHGCRFSFQNVNKFLFFHPTTCPASSVLLHWQKYISNIQYYNLQALFGFFSVCCLPLSRNSAHSYKFNRAIRLSFISFYIHFVVGIVCGFFSFLVFSPASTCRTSVCAQHPSSDMCWVHTLLNPRHNPLFICVFTYSIDGPLSGLIRLKDNCWCFYPGLQRPSWNCNCTGRVAFSPLAVLSRSCAGQWNSASARVHSECRVASYISPNLVALKNQSTLLIFMSTGTELCFNGPSQFDRCRR